MDASPDRLAPRAERNIPAAVVHNGLWPHEFNPVPALHDASDLLFVGEQRLLKGVDVLIQALAKLNELRPVSATIVGDGPDRDAFQDMVDRYNLGGQVRFTGVLRVLEAFRLGRVIVIPSRAESFPYIALEAIAAEKPIVASRVGGIPEVLPTQMLVAPDNVGELAKALEHALDHPDELIQTAKTIAQSAMQRLDVQSMATNIVDFYKKLPGTVTTAH